MKIVWLPASWADHSAQSNTATAPRKHGAPVAAWRHSPTAKSKGSPWRGLPAKVSETCACAAARTLIENTPFSRTARLAGHRSALDAGEDERRLGRHRAHGADGHGEAPRLAVGGDHG